MKAFDANFNNEFFNLKNPNKVCYSAIHWDENVLYLADELGFVGVLNVYMDKPFVWKKLSEWKINKIQVVH